MLAVMLRADGWRVEFLGADTPPVDSAIAFADRIGATMLCLSAARDETVELLRASLASTKPPTDAALVLGGAGVTPQIARELRATHAAGELDLAVGRLRSFASR